MNRVLVTGGLGSIGQNLIRGILNDSTRVLVLDDTSSSDTSFVVKDERVEFRHCDISNREKVQIIVKNFQPHYVYHLAAHFANQNSVEFPYSDLQTNVVGTMNILEALIGQTQLKKIVYASSSCVYGGEKSVMSEEDYIYPFETPYAINKYAAELYVRYYAHFHKIPSISLRIFNTYGPGEIPGRYRNVIPNFIKLALFNEDIVITGTGKETRDFTFVTDTVDLLVLLATSSYKEGEVFNGGTGNDVEIIRLANAIIQLTDSKSKVIFKPRRDWDLVEKRVASIEKSRSLLGYNPKVSLEEGLKATIPWYRELLLK